MNQPLSSYWNEQIRPRFVPLVLICVLGLVFFVRNAHFHLASDDISWLHGEAPTPFDQYRLLPRFFFVTLYALLGPSVFGALTMILVFHVANTLLVYILGMRLLENKIAAIAATAVFMINPITLSTLTWISCFSYVLGTFFALMALGAFLHCRSAGYPGHWSLATLGFYGLGLLSSHEILFLPVLFLLLMWAWKDHTLKRGLVLFGVATTLAAIVNFGFYNFSRLGVESRRMFSIDFVSAVLSSAWSFGASLALAYPLSFFAKPMDWLQVCFSEPWRDLITLACLASAILFYNPSPSRRFALALALGFVAFIAPYILRLYLMPSGVNYAISYVLSGRVFYLPFVALAWLLGWLWAALVEHWTTKYRQYWLSLIVFLIAYGHALVLYDPTDFMGLSVLQGSASISMPPWNPYSTNHALWLAALVFAVGALVIVRVVGLEPHKLESSRE